MNGRVGALLLVFFVIVIIIIIIIIIIIYSSLVIDHVPLVATINLPALAMNQDLTARILPAGFTSFLACSLCGPGKYQTGTGRDALIGRVEASALFFIYEVVFQRLFMNQQLLA
jgi:hypothetical protein